MTTHYLGTTLDGRIVSRKSTRSDFTHAATTISGKANWCLPSFSTSALGAVKNFGSQHSKDSRCEVVELRIVDPAEYRAATKGINPKTGRPSA